MFENEDRHYDENRPIIIVESSVISISVLEFLNEYANALIV